MGVHGVMEIERIQWDMPEMLINTMMVNALGSSLYQITYNHDTDMKNLAGSWLL